MCSQYVIIYSASKPKYLSMTVEEFLNRITPGRRQWKTLSTIDKHGSKIIRNSVFDCHLSPVWRQMAIEIGVFNCRPPGVRIFNGSFASTGFL